MVFPLQNVPKGSQKYEHLKEQLPLVLVPLQEKPQIYTNKTGCFKKSLSRLRYCQ